jgi:Alpha/beta hydrolase domain
VQLGDYALPAIPGLHKPHEANSAYRLDFGRNWRDGILTIQPPKVGEPFPVLVPQVDADGNERDGVRLPEISIPLATYTSWNLRDSSIGAPDQRVSFEASYLPFPRTTGERQRTGDPRKSIAERYADREDYVARYKNAVDDLVKQRWILQEDRLALVRRGEEEWAEATK